MSAQSYQALARQFIEMWQKQMGSVMNDRDFIQGMLDTLHAMPPNMGGMYEQPGAASSAHAAADTQSGHERMAELDYRLRMCESRISALEGAAKSQDEARNPGAGKRTPDKPAKRR